MTKAYAIIEMQSGLPAVDFTVTPISGFCLGAHVSPLPPGEGRGEGYGLYLVAGSGSQLTALAALPNVWRICTTAELDATISSARRTSMNSWLTAQGWPNIPAGWTYGQVVRYAFARANPAWDEAKHFIVDG